MKYVYRINKRYFTSHIRAWKYMNDHYIIGDGNALSQTNSFQDPNIVRTYYLNGHYTERITLNF